ncbi:hypothetical protein CIB84_012754 [Bambusicola thoracicus]|uniref:Uncharacterized protein n=1 Tax=Bambusicola thoracicus TaxID=9083 RepID=A0A2P4SHC9_BAMTH|nr:hypothetical protein CIB84_012754 [Bambusicola thoracicus]
MVCGGADCVQTRGGDLQAAPSALRYSAVLRDLSLSSRGCFPLPLAEHGRQLEKPQSVLLGCIRSL